MSVVVRHRELTVHEHRVFVDDQLGHLMVAHDGSITWDDMQAIKNVVWGDETRAIEVYPRQSNVVNSGNFRHLWRLGEGDFCPDLLHHEVSNVLDGDTLECRHLDAWSESTEVL